MPNDPTDPSHSSPPGDETIETTFRRLRRDGQSRLAALRVILDRLDLSLAEAKEVLFTSDTWAEARQDSEANLDSLSSDHPPPAPG